MSARLGLGCAVVATLSASVLLAACAGPPPQAPTPAAPMPATSSAPTAAPPRTVAPESLGAGEIRCGIDDGPVRLGQDEAPLRMPERPIESAALLGIDRTGGFLGEMVAPPPVPRIEAAPPRVSLRWTLGDGLVASPAFTERAHACSATGLPADAGERPFLVRTGSNGIPIAVRATDAAHMTSKLTTCFASALCLASASPTAAGPTTTGAQLATAVEAPRFVGTVDVQVHGDRSLGRDFHSRRGRHPVPPLAPPTKADLAYQQRTSEAVKPGIAACLKATPPGDDVMFTLSFARDPKSAGLRMNTVSAPTAFQRDLELCAAQAAEKALTPAPASLSKSGTVFLVVSVDIAQSAGARPSP